MIVIGSNIYLKKVGFLWGPVEGFDADVADDIDVIRFYHKRDLRRVLKDEVTFRKLLESAISSRASIPYAKKTKGKVWILECDDLRVKVKSTMKIISHDQQFGQPLLRGQGAGIPAQASSSERST